MSIDDLYDPNLEAAQERARITASERAGLTPIQDGQKLHLTCSACGKAIVEVWITHPKDPRQSNLAATCPFCGDKSYPLPVNGVFHVAGENGIYIIDIETLPNLTTFITKAR